MKFHDEFRYNLATAVKHDYLDLRNKIINEEFYAGCLVIDEDVSGMFLIFNTIEYLKEKDSVLFKKDPYAEFRKMLAPEEFQKSFGQYEKLTMSTKWIPDDWGYGNNLLEDSLINKLNLILHNKSESLQHSERINFERKIHKAMMDSLLSLKMYIKESLNSDIFLFMSVTDSKNSKLIENKSAKKLNTEISYNEFIKQRNIVTDD
ncbi:DUF4303 domain-containing protein [Citrobacter enshiensis]|uniref:DUF4303 domain-containing protein n=1 Tax=Citrobacter enshiensis TaxID=2971264 RepID=UPI0023E780FE|nr:DUF4303 domain-containing protein [Citrobacter enshiensis]WET42271.1 DUF4303 domain-containing protein [Citrobacter enshiensis]